MKPRLLLALLILPLAASNADAARGIAVGAGMIYNPTAKLEYTRNPEANYEIIDNVIWEPRLFYDFGNGFRAGARFNIYRKRIFPGGSTRSDVSFWDMGLLGEYNCEFTESGRSLLVGGMETGYGELSDKSNAHSNRAGSLGVAAYGGLRFMLARHISLEMDYRFGWLEFDLGSSPEKKYNYSGSGLRLSVAYQFRFGPTKTED